jgi:hypothetical protein
VPATHVVCACQQDSPHSSPISADAIRPHEQGRECKATEWEPIISFSGSQCNHVGDLGTCILKAAGRRRIEHFRGPVCILVPFSSSMTKSPTDLGKFSDPQRHLQGHRSCLYLNFKSTPAPYQPPNPPSPRPRNSSRRYVRPPPRARQTSPNREAYQHPNPPAHPRAEP